MTRADARAAHETTYTGSPCKTCEETLRYTSSGNCVACTKRRTTDARPPATEQAVGGECQCCGRPADELVRDIAHETGLERGRICRSCNRVLGLLGDSPATIQKFLDYLTREPMPWE